MPYRQLACGLLLAPACALAEPFGTFNHGALARSTALPVLGRAAVGREGSQAWEVAYDLTNEYHLSAEGAELIGQDGETSRYALRWRSTIGGIEWGAELPVLSVGGGFLDGFIEDWHGWFGLPNGGREQVPHGLYRYRYERNGTTVFDRRETGTALGDVTLEAGRALHEGLALRALVKLPTGSESRMTGGNAGGAVWLDWGLPATSTVGAFASIGLSANAAGEPLPDQQRTLVPIGAAGTRWRALDRIELAVQLYAHGPLYEDSDLAALKRAGLQVAFGGSWLFDAGTRLEIAVQEDLITLSSPDFSLHIGLKLAPI